MRRTYYLFGFVLLLVSCATQQKLSYADIKYQEIIDLPGKNKSEIYESTLQSMASIFNSSKAVLQYQNKEDGKIIGKGITDVVYSFMPVETHFTITIDIKDEKIRITFTDMYTVLKTYGTTPLNYQSEIDSFSGSARNIINEIKRGMNQKKNDW